MNRDFEKEYIALAQDEIPDLWDRIEAGLSERTAPETKQISKTKTVSFWRKYAGLAAAVLCAVVVIPAFMRTRQMNKSASFEAEAEAPAGAAQTTEECAAEEAAEAVYDTTAESGAGSMEEASHETAESYDAAAMPEAGVEDLNEEMDTARKENVFKKEEAASGAASMQQDMGENLLLENISVQVTEEKYVDTKEAGKVKDSVEGTLYKAIVLQDPSGTFSTDEQIEIYIPEAFRLDTIVGNEFKIDIVCDEDGEYPFVVDKISTLFNETGQ